MRGESDVWLDASGAAVLAAELLLSGARYGQAIHRLADVEQAAALAIRARNARGSSPSGLVAEETQLCRLQERQRPRSHGPSLLPTSASTSGP